MSGRLIDALLKLTPRERGLLALACLVALPLAMVFGLLLPLHDKRDSALAARAEAQALHEWVAARIDEKAGLAATSASRIGPPIGSAGIEQSLIDAKLRGAVSALGVQSDGSVELRFDQVNFVRFANWLSATHPGWGYLIRSYLFEPADTSGSTAVRLILVPPET